MLFLRVLEPKISVGLCQLLVSLCFLACQKDPNVHLNLLFWKAYFSTSKNASSHLYETISLQYFQPFSCTSIGKFRNWMLKKYFSFKMELFSFSLFLKSQLSTLTHKWSTQIYFVIGNYGSEKVGQNRVVECIVSLICSKQRSLICHFILLNLLPFFLFSLFSFKSIKVYPKSIMVLKLSS